MLIRLVRGPRSTVAQSSTTLERAIRAMAPNSWATIDMPGLGAALAAISIDASVYAYCVKGVYYHGGRKIWCSCQSHGTYVSALIQYDLVSETWDCSQTPPVPSGEASPSHGYAMNAVSSLSGELYFHQYSNQGIRRRPLAGSWSDATAENLPGGADATPIDFNPALNSGAGGLVSANIWGLTTSDSGVTSWTVRGLGTPSAGTLTIGYGGNAIAYNPPDQCSYTIGGLDNAGNGAATSMVRVTPAGVCTQMGTLPAACYIPDAGNDCSVGFSGVGGKSMMIIGLGNTATGMYSYSAAGDSWSLASTRPFSVSQGNTFVVPIDLPAENGLDADGAYLFVGTDNGIAPWVTMHLYKPA